MQEENETKHKTKPIKKFRKQEQVFIKKLSYFFGTVKGKLYLVLGVAIGAIILMGITGTSMFNNILDKVQLLNDINMIENTNTSNSNNKVYYRYTKDNQYLQLRKTNAELIERFIVNSIALGIREYNDDLNQILIAGQSINQNLSRIIELTNKRGFGSSGLYLEVMKGEEEVKSLLQTILADSWRDLVMTSVSGFDSQKVEIDGKSFYKIRCEANLIGEDRDYLVARFGGTIADYDGPIIISNIKLNKRNGTFHEISVDGKLSAIQAASYGGALVDIEEKVVETKISLLINVFMQAANSAWEEASIKIPIGSDVQLQEYDTISFYMYLQDDPKANLEEASIGIALDTRYPINTLYDKITEYLLYEYNGLVANGSDTSGVFEEIKLTAGELMYKLQTYAPEYDTSEKALELIRAQMTALDNVHELDEQLLVFNQDNDAIETTLLEHTYKVKNDIYNEIKDTKKKAIIGVVIFILITGAIILVISNKIMLAFKRVLNDRDKLSE